MSPEDKLLDDGTPEIPTDPYGQVKLTVTSDTVDVENIIVDKPLSTGDYIGAFAKVYELAGLNAEDYRIVDDSVRFSAWQQSKRLENGDRDTVTLYSYRARFQRISPLEKSTELVVNNLAEELRKRRKSRRTLGTGLGPACTYTVLPSDWQFGKNEIREKDLKHGRTGVEQTTWRIERMLDESQRRIKTLRRLGKNIEGIGIGFMGDPTENVSDSYTNQPFIIEMNLRSQIEHALDMSTLICEELIPLSNIPAEVWATLCNHGQLSRRGTKTNVTDDADNVQNLIMSLLKDRIVGPAFPGTHWHLPEQEMITTLTLSGIPIAAAHGHKIPSGSNGEFKWLAAQTANLAEKRGHRPRLWLTAHRHSHDQVDYGAFHRLQVATADGGSKHFEDGSGIYSTPGTSSVLIGTHNERGFSDFELL